jgi:hypothetical protein
MTLSISRTAVSTSRFPQKIDVQQTIKVSANISIELKVGASKILLEQSGITIEAPTITIKSLGPMTVKGTPISIN